MNPPRTRQSPVPPDQCNLARAIEIVGDKWNLMILRSALYGVRRFEDFHAELGVPRTVLSGRLKALVASDLLTGQTYKEPGKRSRTEYVLTDRGHDLRGILIALTQWGDRWLADGDAPISFTEKSGGAVKTGFVNETGEEVASQDLRVVLRK
ncbi:MAG: helix-turn-helix domain-containing protein [Pseudomonadota bacterium]